jgi:hypothetical protein
MANSSALASLFAPMSYPNSPGFKAPGPSQQAARAMSGTAKTLRARVLECFRDAPNGLTADQVATQLGETVLATRPRCSELYQLGEIPPTPERRANTSGLLATVWTLATPLPGG